MAWVQAEVGAARHGTFQQLLECDGLFRELWMLQADRTRAGVTEPTSQTALF
ncbi:hypothetical protein ACFXJ5_09310 [Streptomyces sp. NPDC059373]